MQKKKEHLTKFTLIHGKNSPDSVRTEGKFLNLMRNVCKKSSAYIVFIDERLIAFPIDQEQGCCCCC